MSRFRYIREQLLHMTQKQLGDQLGMSQGNVGHYEADVDATRHQTVPPDVAQRLIKYAASRGVTLSFDQIYGDAELPAPLDEPPPEPSALSEQPKAPKGPLKFVGQGA